MLDRLAEYIDKTLDEPEPVAPTLQQPRPFTGWEAAAGALNPQLIPFLSQRAGQQSELANQSALLGFQGALGRRKEAFGLAGDVISARGQLAGRDLDERRLAETGRHNLAMESRPRTRVVYDRQGNAYEEDIDTQETRPIRLPQGEQAGKPFTEETTNRVASLLSLREKSSEVLKHIQSLATVPQGARSVGRMARGVERFITGGTDITGNVAPGFEVSAAAIDDMADVLLRMRSGAQINEQEYARLRSLLPGIGENPFVMQEKMARFNAELDSIIATRSQMQGIPTGVRKPASQRLQELLGLGQ